MRWVVVTLSLAAAATLTAASAETSAVYDVCIADSGGATAVVLDCMAAEIRRQEAELERWSRRFLRTLNPASATRWQETQRLWRSYRNKQCAFFHHPRSGSGGVVDVRQCVLEETARHLAIVRALVVSAGM